MEINYNECVRVVKDSDYYHRRFEDKTIKKTVAKTGLDVYAKYGHLCFPGTPLFPLDVAIAITKEVSPDLDLEKFMVYYKLYNLDETYYVPDHLGYASTGLFHNHYGYAYEDWVEGLIAKHEEELLKQEEEAYVYYDAEYGYFENEAREILVKTDDQVQPKETVINTSNTEETTMSKFTFDRNAEINSQVKKEDSVEDTVKQTSTVQVPVQINTNTNTNTNNNTEVKTMTVLATSSNVQEQQVINEFEITVEDFQAIKALNLGKPFFTTTGRGNFKLVAEVEALFSNAASIQAMPVVLSAPVVSEPVEIEANPGMLNSTIAKLCAEQAASNEAVETVENTNTNTNTKTNTEVKPMTSFQERKAVMQAEYDATVEETNSDKRGASFKYSGKKKASEEEILEAMMAEDNTEAAANGQEKSKEIASTNTKTNSIPKTKTMDNTAPKTLIALNIVLNIVKVGGAAGRTSAMIKQRKEKWNVLRNKKASTICDLKGIGSICFNRETDIPFLQFASLYLENGVSEAYGNSNAVLIEEYSDGTKKMLNTEETEAAWRTILNADDDVVIGNLNLKLKADLPMSSSDLMDKLDDGTIQAINFRFDKPNDKMFTFKQVARYNGTEFDTYLYMPGTSVISFLRDSADFDKDFLNYKGKKSSPKNKFGNSSKVVGNRNLPSQAVVARPQTAAAVAGAQNMFEVGVPKTAAVPAPVAVAVVIDTEKDTLRAENVALKAEVSELKTQIADLTAGQTRMEAMLAQLVAAQAVKTVEVSIPEIVEVVAPAAPVEVSAFDIALEASIQARLASDELAIHDCDPLDEGYAAEMAARSAADNARRTLFSLAIPQVELDARIAEAKANLEVCNAADKAAGKPQFGVDNAETAYANTKFNQLKNLQSAEKKAENAVSGTLFS